MTDLLFTYFPYLLYLTIATSHLYYSPAPTERIIPRVKRLKRFSEAGAIHQQNRELASSLGCLLGLYEGVRLARENAPMKDERWALHCRKEIQRLFFNSVLRLNLNIFVLLMLIRDQEVFTVRSQSCLVSPFSILVN